MMIDFAKLKEAFNIADKYSDHAPEISIELIGDGRYKATLGYWIDGHEHFFRTGNASIDDVVDKLKELTKPEPKHKIGDTVWILNDEYEPEYFVIVDVEIDYISIIYLDDEDGWLDESQVYPSKESLIKAQIEYWSTMCICDEDRKTYCPVCGYDSEETPPDLSALNSDETQPDLSGTKLEEYINGWNENEIQKTNLLWPEHNSSVRVGVSCEHESDGYAYVLGKSTGIKLPQIPSAPHNFKCKKCGKFYR